MEHKNSDQENLLRNLIDAGCSEENIERIISMRRDNNINDMLVLLAQHRKQLLDRSHITQHQLECLDYLTNSLKAERSR
ncbi:MAG: hypothetical protein ACOX4I_00160 [Anaerovoracaceae bacterium]|jgi:hypothetical protein